MRETFKSLSIFSAMLMLLLMISTGCDVNIPGCGKRSLPFFSKTAPVASASSTAPMNNSQTAPAAPSANNITTAAKPVAMSPMGNKTDAPTPVPTVVVDVEKIAYTTIENGLPTLWTMNTDGSERTRLTPKGTSSWHPLWSPNGKILAFLSNVNDGKVNLFTVQKGSTALVQVTSWEDMQIPDPSLLQSTFTWSPKSDQIAYSYKNQLWVIELDNLEQTSLETVDPAYSVVSVQWAPHRDNKFIAYTVRKGANYYSVMMVNPRLKDSLTLVDSSKTVPQVSWSSGAERVIYVSGTRSVYSTTIEDTTPKPIILNASPELAPFVAYSPADASTRILLLAKKTLADTAYRVAVVDQPAKNDQDTGTLKYLTTDGVDAATWSPDGTKIAYVAAGELWIMDSTSGAGKTRIALTGIQSPDWSKK